MNSSIVFFLCIPGIFASAIIYPIDKPCPDDTDCRLVKECIPVFSKLTSYKKGSIAHGAFINYLRVIKCGYDGFDSKVCCPKEIPSEVIDIVENKKYWTVFWDPIGIKKLEDANSKPAENHSPKELKIQDQFPGCGRYLWHESFDGGLADTGDYPWLALLQYNIPVGGKQLLCGGVLISDQHILTAAHCVTLGAYDLTSVILGEYDINDNSDSAKKYEVDHYIIHDGYNDGPSPIGFLDNDVESDLHDIALIKLKKKVQFSDDIQPICLPFKKPKSKRFIISGWQRSPFTFSKGSNLKLMSNLYECQRSDYERHEIQRLYDKKEHICAAGRERNQQPCIGDSGGPLMAVERKEDGIAKFTVFGISHSETRCGEPGNLPRIFTNVYNYKDWIIKKMNA